MAKNSYETKLVNLVKKADSIRGCVKDGYIYVSIDDHAIIKMVDSTYNGMILSKMGIYYIKTNAGKYDMIKGNFVQVLDTVPDKLTKLFDFIKEDIFMSKFIYMDDDKELVLYPYNGHLQAIQKKYYDIMKNMNSPFWTEKGYIDRIIGTYDSVNDIMFGAMPYHLEHVEVVDKIKALSDYLIDFEKKAAEWKKENSYEK